jgi:hypothetical protein
MCARIAAADLRPDRFDPRAIGEMAITWALSRRATSQNISRLMLPSTLNSQRRSGSWLRKNVEPDVASVKKVKNVKRVKT